MGTRPFFTTRCSTKSLSRKWEEPSNGGLRCNSRSIEVFREEARRFLAASDDSDEEGKRKRTIAYFLLSALLGPGQYVDCFDPAEPSAQSRGNSPLPPQWRARSRWCREIPLAARSVVFQRIVHRLHAPSRPIFSSRWAIPSSSAERSQPASTASSFPARWSA